jgi:large subunit ribosomal protein L24
VAAKASKSAKSERIATVLRKGDLVMVISGGNKNKRAIKGQVAKIKAFVGDKKQRVILEGLNLVVKHKRAATPGEAGGKIKVESSIHISNVMFYVEKIKRPVRLVSNTLADGTRVRGYKDPESKSFVQIEA